MVLAERLVNGFFRFCFRIFFRLNLDVLNSVRTEGPLLIITNHPSIFEGPMLYVFLQPRPLIGLAKRELFLRKTSGWLMKLWQAIPVDVHGLSKESMDRVFQEVDKSSFLVIAPEGVRTNEGTLRRGKPGVAYIAYRKQVPVLPITTVGFEGFWKNLKRLRRTTVSITVGNPFEFFGHTGRLTPALRQEMTDEMMLRLAPLLPEQARGVYRDWDYSWRYTRETEVRQHHAQMS